MGLNIDTVIHHVWLSKRLKNPTAEHETNLAKKGIRQKNFNSQILMLKFYHKILTISLKAYTRTRLAFTVKMQILFIKTLFHQDLTVWFKSNQVIQLNPTSISVL